MHIEVVYYTGNCPLVRSLFERGLAEVLGPLLVEPVPEVEHEVVEDGGVDVLAHLEEDEPVAVVALLEDGAEVVTVHRLAALREEQVAHGSEEREKRARYCKNVNSDILFPTI